MKLVPLNKNVAVIKLKNKLETDSGIVLTKATGEIDKAKVIAIGPEVTDVANNDILLIDWNKSTMHTFDGFPVYMINQDNIVAVFDEQEPA